MTQIHTLKKNGENIYPLTHMKGVVDDNGNTMDVLLAEAEQRALRKLFVAAGAEYNDTDQIIKKTAFWGEEVDHLPKHYYLNGLGDITEDEMMIIYQYKDSITTLIASGNNGSRFFQDLTIPRTLFGTKNTARWISDKTISTTNPFANNNLFEILKWTNTQSLASIGDTGGVICNTASFFNCKKIRVIDRCRISRSADWRQVPNIEELRLHFLEYNVVLSSNTKISKASILYMIDKVKKNLTTAITITLNAATYAKCVEGGEWYEDVNAALTTANAAITGGGSINIASA